MTKIFCLVLMAGLPLYGGDSPSSQRDPIKWGDTYEEFIRNMPKDLQSETFTLDSRPDYTNTILNYITGINGGLNNKTVILRHLIVPIKDYIFINNRLSLITFQWENPENNNEKKILTDLGSQYGTPEIKSLKKETIYTYNNKTTKVMMYKTEGDNGSIKLKIYYYPRNLFRLLIME